MIIKSIQDILPMVELPSRYLGTEINRVKKDPAHAKLHVALAFPDLYEIGMSNFGIQILYHILNNHKEIAAERVFAPAMDMEAHLRTLNIPLTTLETQTPLKDVDIIGFSLLYELTYTNILTMLDLASIPFFSYQRDESHPVVIAGGPCTLNPEPVADFFDAMVIGDGEETIMEMAKAWLAWNDSKNRDKKALLSLWSSIEGIYIPSFFETKIDSPGFRTRLPKEHGRPTITRAVISDLNNAPFPDQPILPYGKPIHDRLRLEISRGCTRGCRFCQAGMIYRPVRERSMENLLALAIRSLASSGYGDISLLSLSTGDYGCIVPLMEQLIAHCEKDHTAVSFPSLRAETLTPQLMSLIKRIRKTGFTIAPEAGSQRLRNIINKNITETEIVSTVGAAFDLGWQVIKLYFMIGLPSETEDDIEAIVDLVKKLRKTVRLTNRFGKINVSVSTFVPKSHTPFQWAGQISLVESKNKIRHLHNKLKMRGIQFKWQNPEASFIEGLWARGDSALSSLLVKAYQNGCRLDGWSDNFRFDLWDKAISEAGLDAEVYTSRQRELKDPLPWDHIDSRVEKSFLINEWKKALDGDMTQDCRSGDCNACGVCDFETIAPCVFEIHGQKIKPPVGSAASEVTDYKQIKISYSKKNLAKHFGHLELVKIFVRALKRAGIPVKYSQGFHPMPKIAFSDPLPIGTESLDETCYLFVPVGLDPDAIRRGLNDQLPDGLVVHGCDLVLEDPSRRRSVPITYLVEMKNVPFNAHRLKQFINMKSFVYTRTNRKGRLKKIDLKDMVSEITLLDSNQIKITLRPEKGFTVRPDEVIREIFKPSEADIKTARIVKLG